MIESAKVQREGAKASCKRLIRSALVAFFLLSNMHTIAIVEECVFLPSRWRYVVISAYCNPSHFFCDPSHLPVIGKVACGAVQYVGGTSLVLVLINVLLQPLTTCV